MFTSKRVSEKPCKLWVAYWDMGTILSKSIDALPQCCQRQVNRLCFFKSVALASCSENRWLADYTHLPNNKNEFLKEWRVPDLSTRSDPARSTIRSLLLRIVGARSPFDVWGLPFPFSIALASPGLDLTVFFTWTCTKRHVTKSLDNNPLEKGCGIQYQGRDICSPVEGHDYVMTPC